MPEKNDIVTDVCKRCVIGGVSVLKWNERGAQVMRERNGGGCDRPRPFSIIAKKAGFRGHHELFSAIIFDKIHSER